ncbi:hypothetical protein LJY25_14095 [Hymenobacter sp. BT175]|uniref:hypothetical protein n=1 Tax=Hymenobacter translucens TaxID=2886507 RepID=UPI001D0E9F5F|nr:hypothetical protein [Hymenobacter translucens]MCC2547584.1 hypothetical protein [Hymenobacter translucens]
MFKQLLLIPALAILMLTGCNHRKCSDPEPRASCVMGTVVGKTCYDGVLIQVSGSRQIGSAWNGNTNVISTGGDLPGFDTQGQTVYFNYRPMGDAEWMPRPCPAIGVPSNTPRMVLSNVSSTACAAVIN